MKPICELIAEGASAIPRSCVKCGIGPCQKILPAAPPKHIHDHNERVEGIIKSIVADTLENGGEPKDVLALLESVMVGTIMSIVQEGSEAELLLQMASRAQGRIREAHQLKNAKVGGVG